MKILTQKEKMDLVCKAVMKILKSDSAEEWLDDYSYLINLNKVIDYGTALDEVEEAIQTIKYN